MTKRHREFFSIDALEWRPVAGGVDGLTEAVLAVDEDKPVATRLLRFEPGTDTSAMGPQAHSFSEEVFILDGQLYDLMLDRMFAAGMYACRPPGAVHGPWVSEKGCLALEVRYP